MRGAARAQRLAWQVRVARLRARVHFAASAAGGAVDLEIGEDVRLDAVPEVYVHPGTRSRLVVGPGARIGSLVRIELRGGELVLGPRADIRRLCRLNAKGRCTLGEDVLLSTGVHLHCAESITIADWSIVGEYSTIADSNHVRTGVDEHVYHSGESAPISIGRNVWVGAKATLAKGVTVGDQAFVGANAVVTRDVEPWWLVAGNPARPVKRLEEAPRRGRPDWAG